ncbi:MAG: LysM peptidoglycan-binding domain-containing protein [Dehalococcoidia bacterium]|nr:LysM peptidoglycan-binding domain-containing protein [Dehalococcoidia bacterium]MYA51923.1 LysM peptidoglycan-binding domain-containing protein [Dehalococcoidia bacterium]
MSLPVESEGSEAAGVCAYLGLVDDSDLHATYATDAHRCYRLPNPTRIATQHQEQFCLTADHPSCPIYQGEGVEATTQATPPPSAEAGTEPEEATEEGEFEPAPSSRPTSFATAASRWTSGGLRRPVLEGEMSMRAATASLFVLAAVVVAIAFVVNRQLGDDDVSVIAPATEEPTAAATPAPTTAQPTATPVPTEAPTPTPPPTPAPTEPPATPAPTEAPVATTYEIQPGDTCSGIAVAHEVTLQELLDANGLTEEDCLTIQPGQELTIP